MRKLILNLHLYLALIAGIFVVILGMTGGIMAFEDDLDRMMNRKLFYSEPKGDRLAPGAILDHLKTAYPGQRFGVLRLPVRPDDSYVTSVRGAQVFVDSYTGQIHGSRSGPTLLGNIHQLHLRLLIGKPGETIVGIVGLVILFLVISGLYLWWPLKRATVKFGASTRRISFDLHNAVGIYSAVFLFVLAVTGSMIAYDEITFPWIHKMAHSAPPKRGVPSKLQAGVAPIRPDEAIRAASTALPEAMPIAVAMPPNPKASYSIAMRFPEDLTPGGRSWVIVDQYSAQPVYVESSRNPPFGTGVEIANRAIHTGDILGYTSKTLMSLASFMLVIQVITGYWMWWKKLRVPRRVEQAEKARV